ncbi:MAG: hypothetical protein ACOX61_05715, partial [Brooklawnia sp.]
MSNDPPARRAAPEGTSMGARVLRAAWLFLLVALLGLAGYLGWMLVVTNKQAVNNARHATADFVAACAAGAELEA